MKTIFIPWTGGLDSTYLIYKNLKEGNNVVSGSIVMLNNIAQSISEYLSRAKNLELLSKIANENNVKFDYRPYNYIVFDVPSSEYSLGQLPIISIAYRYWQKFFHDIDSYQLGYIKGDCFFNDGYEKAFSDTFNTMENHNFEGRKQIVELPLRNIEKSFIYNELPNEIKNNISYCEQPFYLNDEEREKYITKFIMRKEMDVSEIEDLIKIRTVNSLPCNCVSCERMNKIITKLSLV